MKQDVKTNEAVLQMISAFVGMESLHGPITSWEIDGETVETVTDFICLGSKITADGLDFGVS